MAILSQDYWGCLYTSRLLRSNAAKRLVTPLEKGRFQDSAAQLFNKLCVSVFIYWFINFFLIDWFILIYILSCFIFICIISNYWIRLPWDIKNSEDRGGCYPPRPKTPSSICRILHILRKTNSTIALSFLQNNSKFKNKLKHAATC